MYTVFIVDDELFVVKSLKTCVDWGKYGYEIIGEAYDGLEAYDMILKHKPDIVFIDIRMPGMDGLELIKKLNGHSLNIIFVIISGYPEFSYAQKAINFGAFGFCLKPFDESELKTILKKAIPVIKKRKITKENELLSLFGENSPEGHRQTEKILNSLSHDTNYKSGIKVMISKGTGKLIFRDDTICILKIGKSRDVYLLNGNLKDIKEYLPDKELPNDVFSLGISNVHNIPEGLELAINEATIAADQYFMTGNRGIYQYNTSDNSEYPELLNKLQKAVSKKDISSTEKCLEQFRSLFAKGMFDLKHAFQVYNIIIYSFISMKPEKYEAFVLDYEMLPDSFINLNEMLNFLKQIIFEYSGIKIENNIADQKTTTFAGVLDYVNKHYFEEISVQSISQKFNVNPNYISQLFKKEKGVTFTEYLTELRINYACRLLSTTTVTVTEIAEKTGFSDYYYFTRVFKKVTGKTPSVFREGL